MYRRSLTAALDEKWVGAVDAVGGCACVYGYVDAQWGACRFMR